MVVEGDADKEKEPQSFGCIRSESNKKEAEEEDNSTTFELVPWTDEELN